ncbi:hypothetical protein ACWDGI_42820 [Streptomyces sp. NPDC001220]
MGERGAAPSWGELEEQLVKQLDQVRTEQEELAVAERVVARTAEQLAAAAADATPAEVQVAGRVVLLVPHRGPGMAQDALPPDYQRIMAVVRDAGGPVSTRQVGQELGLEVTVRGKAESAKTAPAKRSTHQTAAHHQHEYASSPSRRPR